MAEHSSLEGKVEALAKQIDTQARFTRGVILLCTSAVIAAMFYTITEVLNILPKSMIAATESLSRTAHSQTVVPVPANLPALTKDQIAKPNP